MSDCCTPDERRRIKRWANCVADECVADLDKLSISTDKHLEHTSKAGFDRKQIVPYVVETISRRWNTENHDAPIKVVRRYRSKKGSPSQRKSAPHVVNVTVRPSTSDESRSVRRRKPRTSATDSDSASLGETRSKSRYDDRRSRPASPHRRSLFHAAPKYDAVRRALGFSRRGDDLSRGPMRDSRRVGSLDVHTLGSRGIRSNTEDFKSRSFQSRQGTYEATTRKSSNPRDRRSSLHGDKGSYYYVDDRTSERRSPRRTSAEYDDRKTVESTSFTPRRSRTVYSSRNKSRQEDRDGRRHRGDHDLNNDVFDRVDRIQSEVERLKAKALAVSPPEYRTYSRDHDRRDRRASSYVSYDDYYDVDWRSRVY